MNKDILIISKDKQLEDRIIDLLSFDFVLHNCDAASCFDFIETYPISCILDYTNDINTIKKLKLSQLSEFIPILAVFDKIDTSSIKEYINAGAYDLIELSTNYELLSLRIKEAINVLSHPRSLVERPTFDRLCEIYNEETLHKEIKKILDERKEDSHYYIVRFDINKFTMINYFFGVKYGEDVLRLIANSLSQASVDHNMCYGRLNKDRFAFLIEGSDLDLKEVINEIKNGVKDYNKDYDIELTFGVYEVNDYSLTVQQMIDYAALAAKTIKGIIGPAYIKYDDKMRNELALEQNYISSFDSALKNREFIVYFQPKYDIIMGKIVGAEALVRWGRNGTIISPGEFIPIFERNGLIDRLDRYVWEETVKYIRWRMDNKLPIFGISVNVSRIFLSMNNFIDDIVNLVKKYNVSSRYLELEITESIFSNVTLIKETVKKLRAKGFKILMDDFGSGYSGLNVLKDVEFDSLKIDLKFFSRNDKKSQDIIKSVLDIAHAIDIPAIAEGVETIEYVELLKKYGCNYAQGFYYSKPLPIDEFNKLCERDCASDLEISDTKYLNIHHVEQAIGEFMDKMTDYCSISDTEINSLLASYVKELKVDCAYLAVASAEANICYFTNSAASKKDYLLTGIELPITIEEYISQCMLYDDEGLSEIPGIPMNERPYKSILYYGLTRGNLTDGVVGIIDYNRKREWSAEERKAVKMLGRCLNLIVYRKRNEMIRKQNEKKEKELRLAYEKLEAAQSETTNFLSLIISALNGIPVRIVKYNFTTNKGCYYKPLDNLPIITDDNKAFDELCDFYDSSLEKTSDNFRSEIENLTPGVIKSYIIQSYECIGQVVPDTKLHTTVFRIQTIEVNHELIMVALLFDYTEILNRNRKGVLEADKIKNMITSTFGDDFVDLTKIDLSTNEIYKFSRNDNDIEGRVLHINWNKLIKYEVGLIVEEEIRNELLSTLNYDNLKNIEANKEFKYEYTSRYQMAKEPRHFSMVLKKVVNIDGSESIIVFTLDVSHQRANEDKLNEEIKKYKELATLDALTEIYNRRGMEFAIDSFKNLIKPNTNQYLLFLDADYFKEINDKYGHLEGDIALKTIANSLTAVSKDYPAIACRTGGDEFVLLISISSQIDIKNVIDKIKSSLYDSNKKYEINITVGVAKADSDKVKNLNIDYINNLILIADDDLRNKKQIKKIKR